MSTVIVTKLSREEGFWTANVSVNGTTVAVDRRFGSWQGTVRAAPGSREFVRRPVLPRVEAALQERVRPIERAEKKAAAEAARAVAA